MASTNIVEFKSQIGALQEKLGLAAKFVMQKITFDLEREITKRTPRDTGRAAANWFVTQGEPSTEVHEYKGAKTGEIPEPSPPDVTAITGNEPVYIINNLAYIEALEHGHSSKAPNGMVALAMQSVAERIQAETGVLTIGNEGQQLLDLTP